MLQYIDTSNFSFFIDSDEARYRLQSRFACTNGTLFVFVKHYTAEGSEISKNSKLILCAHVQLLFVFHSLNLHRYVSKK
jgi:hypothetical protein